MPDKKVIVIGYSGHSLVVCDALLLTGWEIVGYCDREEKLFNPFQIPYLGDETNPMVLNSLPPFVCYVAIGDNAARERVFEYLQSNQQPCELNAIHPSAVVASSVNPGNGIFVGANVCINPFAVIGRGAICNTNCTIEHECIIGEFVHIAPGAVLAGNVQVGRRTFIGANSVIKQGIAIGEDVTIGAGTVVIRDVPSGATVVGNPGRVIKLANPFNDFGRM